MEKPKLPRYPLKVVCLFIQLLVGSIVCAQVTSISGIVNSYYSVTEVIPSRVCVRVSNTAGLASATKVLLVQMKGGTINTSSASSSTWGDTVSLNNAGNYEVNYICSINGDSVFFVFDLLNSYSATGKIQLVPFARYQNATVTDTIKAMAWNNTTGTGGVIAIDVIDTLVLNAPVFADSSGFNGGIFFQHGGACPVGSSYAYDATSSSSLNGAYKGEGIADVAAAADGGKGAPANGGGGGNNHNNSGAGGANLSAGGRGGGNSSTGPIGCNTGNNFGMGGRALSSWGGKKIFAGGGGGAGHNNNAIFQFGGADGGGIIFIHADTLIGNGYPISANGGNAGRSQGDGAGGGGAGGTIIMDVNTYIGAATIRAIGGNGGNSDDVGTPNRCFGGGGGGSGGAIYFSTALPAVNITDTAGTGGLEISRSGCNPAVPGLPGVTGITIPNYTVRQSITFTTYCGTALPSKLIYFRARLDNKKVDLSWRIMSPELAQSFTIERMQTGSSWISIYSNVAIDNQENYFASDASPKVGDNIYRMRITEKTGATYYSPGRMVFINDNQQQFTIFPNPASDMISISGTTRGVSTMKLFDISGRFVFKQQIGQGSNTIKLPKLGSGVYLVRIGEWTEKLVIR